MERGMTTMSHQPLRPPRGEALVRSMLAFALLVAVAWAVMGGYGGFGL